MFDPAAYDDGAVTLSFLHGHFVVRHHEEEEEQSSGVATQQAAPETVPVVPLSRQFPPAIEGDSDEDPFGHLHLGMDDRPYPTSGHAVSRNPSLDADGTQGIVDEGLVRTQHFPLTH